MSGYRPRGQRVPPLSLARIRDIAVAARTLFDVDGEVCMDAARLLEHRLFDFGVVYKVVEKHELGRDEASTRPDLNEIRIRKDVYDALVRGDRRARFTIPHEVGHLILHRGVAFGRSGSSTLHPPYEDSEWQADSFAGEFLAPVGMVQARCSSASDIAAVFGLSMDAAIIRRNVLRRDRLIGW